MYTVAGIKCSLGISCAGVTVRRTRRLNQTAGEVCDEKGAHSFCNLFRVICCPGFLGVAQAKAAEFSADMFIVPKGDEAMKGKIFVKGDKVKQETSGDDETQVMIIRPDKKVTWMHHA